MAEDGTEEDENKREGDPGQVLQREAWLHLSICPLVGCRDTHLGSESDGNATASLDHALQCARGTVGSPAPPEVLPLSLFMWETRVFFCLFVCFWWGRETLFKLPLVGSSLMAYLQIVRSMVIHGVTNLLVCPKLWEFLEASHFLC